MFIYWFKLGWTSKGCNWYSEENYLRPIRFSISSSRVEIITRIAI